MSRESERNAETRVAVREIGGAVERIDVPAIAFGSVAGFVAGAFFGGDGVIGKKFCDARDDGGFGALVGLGDQVDFIAFVGDLTGRANSSRRIWPASRAISIAACR